MTSESVRVLGERLVQYYKDHRRSFPWREEDVNAYQLLVTEVLLRRTAASKVAGVWEEFFQRFPDPESLVSADVEEIRDCIGVLGLQEMRSKHLKNLGLILSKNKEILEDPERLAEIEHIGSYISGAFFLQRGIYRNAPVDVNVKRVITRYSGSLEFSSSIERMYSRLMEEVEEKKELLLGLLDLSSEFCRPVNPRCELCPLGNSCRFLGLSRTGRLSSRYQRGHKLMVNLSPREFRILVDSELVLEAPRFPNRTALLYVRNPQKAVIGTVKIRRENSSSIVLSALDYFEKRISLNVLQNLWSFFLPHGKFNWMEKDMFLQIMRL